MASGLFDMLSALASDSNLLDTFKSDPGAVMDDFNLTNDQKALITSSINSNDEDDFLQAVKDEAMAQFSFSDPDILFC